MRVPEILTAQIPEILAGVSGDVSDLAIQRVHHLESIRTLFHVAEQILASKLEEIVASVLEIDIVGFDGFP